MQAYQETLAKLLAQEGALFFKKGLTLKDGRPTPYFFNLGKLKTGRTSAVMGACFADWFMEAGLAGKVDVILGPSYKGSALAQAMAMALFANHGQELAFEYDRKEAKTHGEASGKAAGFVTGALVDGARVLIVDDVGTSMATKVELLDKLAVEQESRGIKLDLAGVVLAVDREQTQAVHDAAGKVVLGQKGPDALGSFREKTGLPVWALLGVRAAMDYYRVSGMDVLVDGEFRPLSDALYQKMQAYLAEYGRELSA